MLPAMANWLVERAKDARPAVISQASRTRTGRRRFGRSGKAPWPWLLSLRVPAAAALLFGNQ